MTADAIPANGAKPAGYAVLVDRLGIRTIDNWHESLIGPGGVHRIEFHDGMPDRQIDLFIRFCLQNHGRLSDRKRSSHFAALTADEIARMEQAVQTAYGTGE